MAQFQFIKDLSRASSNKSEPRLNFKIGNFIEGELSCDEQSRYSYSCLVVHKKNYLINPNALKFISGTDLERIRWERYTLAHPQQASNPTNNSTQIPEGVRHPSTRPPSGNSEAFISNDMLLIWILILLVFCCNYRFSCRGIWANGWWMDRFCIGSRFNTYRI